jgi:predicted nucleotidyltransferase
MTADCTLTLDVVERVSCDLIIDFVSARYKDYSLILFYGSAATGAQEVRSDVDLFVLYDSPIHPYREKVRHLGFLFDIWVYDIETLHGMINVARRSPSAIILEIVLSSTVLPEKTKISDYLKLAAANIRKSKPLIQDIADWRQYITGIVDDLESANHKDDRCLLAMEAYGAITDCLLLILGAGGYKKRHAARILREYDADYFCELNEGLGEAINGNLEKLVKCSKKLLIQLGGELREGFKSSLPEGIRFPLPEL